MARAGVITGRVTNSRGEPLVSIAVQAILRRDANGKNVFTSFFFGRERCTDDRGIYRLYGLAPGTYIVFAGASRQPYNSPQPDAFSGRAPTFHPSATSDTATEINVTAGSEATGVDIIFRNEPGRTIGGTLSGAVDSNANDASSSSSSSISLTLINVLTNIIEGTTFVSTQANTRSFSFKGVPDGEYELTASRDGHPNESGAASMPRRINVHGAD